MASKNNPTEQTSTDDAGVHRLRDIVAEEVSLVDRAANKRRYLVVKRSSPMADDKKLDKKPKSTEEQDAANAAKARTRAARAASEEEDKEEEEEEEDTEKARGASSDENEDDAEEEGEEKAAAGDGQEGDDEEEDEGDEKDEEKADDSEDEDEEEDQQGDEAKRKAGLILPPDAKTGVLQVLAQALERLMAVANQVKEADEPEDGAAVSVPDDLTGELEDVGELLEEVGEQLEAAAGGDGAAAAGAEKSGTTKRGVTKAGRRMAASRLDRFQKALELLSAVLKELTEERKSPGQRPGPPKKPAAKGDTTPGVSDLVVSVRELTKIVKRQDQELTRLAKIRGTSNAIPVDGGRRPESLDEVSWPLDMNRPISRDRVDKSVSFYDDP